MTHDLQKASDLLMEAVHQMAMDPAPIQMRVSQVYDTGLFLLREKNFPKDLRPKFAELDQAFKHIKPKEILTGTKRIRTKTATNIARLIVDLYECVSTRVSE